MSHSAECRSSNGTSWSRYSGDPAVMSRPVDGPSPDDAAQRGPVRGRVRHRSGPRRGGIRPKLWSCPARQGIGRRTGPRGGGTRPMAQACPVRLGVSRRVGLRGGRIPRACPVRQRLVTGRAFTEVALGRCRRHVPCGNVSHRLRPHGGGIRIMPWPCPVRKRPVAERDFAELVLVRSRGRVPFGRGRSSDGTSSRRLRGDAVGVPVRRAQPPNGTSRRRHSDNAVVMSRSAEAGSSNGTS